MPFTPKDWRNSPDTTTPISAAALEDLETRVTDYTDSAAAPAAVSAHRQGFGMNTGDMPWTNSTAQNTLDFDLIRRQGADSIRLTLKWDIVEPTTKGTFVWTKADEIFDLADAQGLEVLFDVQNCPGWAHTGGEPDYHWAPTDAADFADFVTAAVNRYKDRGSGCRLWEIENEPNNSDMFMPNTDSAKYVSVFNAAYTAIKAADPTATVIFGSIDRGGYENNTAQTDLDTYWLNKCYAAGLGDYDVLGYHPYAKGLDPAATTPTGEPTGSELVSNTGFETNTSNWFGDGSTIARVTSPVRTGTGSLRITISGGQWSGAHHDNAQSPVVAGTDYLAQAYVRADTTPSLVGASMFWYDASHVAVSGATNNDGPTITNTTTGWTLLTVRAPAPAGAAFCAVKIADYNASPSGHIHYVDDVSLKAASSTGHGWNRIPLIRAIMVANGDVDKPIWITEVGQCTGSATEAVSEATQATYMANTFTRLRQYPYVDRYWHYAHRDLGTDLAVGDENYGLVRNDGTTVKAAMAVFRDT